MWKPAIKCIYLCVTCFHLLVQLSQNIDHIINRLFVLQEEYQGLRLLSYPGTHVFLMSFSIVMPESMKNLELKWIPEVRHQVPNAAYILVGTQVDLRDDEKIGQKLQKRRQKPVTAEEGQKLAKRLNCECYVECSALTRQGLKDVFDEALIAVLDPKVKKKTATGGRFKCAIL